METVFGGEKQACHCYKECQEFQKLLELKNSGLVVYLHRPRADDGCTSSLIRQGEAVGGAVNPSEDVFIIYNKKNVKITASELTSEFEKKNISCQRCRKTFEHAQEVMQDVKSIDKKIVMGICDHCRKKSKTKKKPLCDCDQIVKKFMYVKGEEKEDTKKYAKKLFPPETGLLRTSATLKKQKKTRTYSDLQINLGLSLPSRHDSDVQPKFYSHTDLKSDKTEMSETASREFDIKQIDLGVSSPPRHDPDVQPMFYSHADVKSDKTDVSETDSREFYRKQAVTFIQPIEPHKGIHVRTPAPSLLESGTSLMEIYKELKEFPRPSLKDHKREEIFEDVPALDAKEALRRRHDLSSPRPSLKDHEREEIFEDVPSLEAKEALKRTHDLSFPRPLKDNKREEIFEDVPSLDAKEALKNRHDLSLRQMMRLDKDTDGPHSVSKRPKVYETTKISPWEQMETIPKYQTKMDVKKIPTPTKSKQDRSARDLDDPNRQVQFRSIRTSQRNIQDSSFEPSKFDKNQQDKILKKDEELKIPRSVGKISRKMKKTKLVSKSESLETVRGPTPDFSFSFPKVREKKNKKIKVGDKSSSRIVKDVQEKYELKAEREKEKLEQVRKKKLAREEKKLQAEAPVEQAKSDKQATSKKEKQGKDETSMKEKQEKDATSKKEKPEKDASSKKEKQEKDAISMKEKQEKDATSKKEKQEKDATTKKERQENDATSTKEKHEKDATFKKEKQEKDATSKKEKDATSKKEKDATSKKEKDATSKKEKDATSKKDKQEDDATSTKEKHENDATSKKAKRTKKTGRHSSDEINLNKLKIQKSLNKEINEFFVKKTEPKRKSSITGPPSLTAVQLQKLKTEHLREKEEKQKLQIELQAKALEKERLRKALKAELKMSNIKIKKRNSNEILKSIRIKQTIPKMMPSDIHPAEIKQHICCHQQSGQQSLICPLCLDSELDLDVLSLETKKDPPKQKTDIIIGENILKCRPRLEKTKKLEGVPIFFQKDFVAVHRTEEEVQIIPEETKPETHENATIEVESGKGVIRYALSDRTFVDKGWTMLPTEKVVRKMNVYRMRPAHPEFDWFEHNKDKRLMTYDTGERLAEFDDNGRGRWYYRSGRLALDYYDAEETNAQQRFVIYSSGEPDERGRTHPITILATFDYLGNGIVFDHAGKIRLKYNQTEGVVLDRAIGPATHWQWHSLNDPPVLQQVMIDTQIPHKDPNILKLGSRSDQDLPTENEDMLAIEFDNFIREKTKKLSQKFKPFQIKMKAMKINEHFSLKILDQATVYLIYRDGTTNMKLNIGMQLDHKEIVDTDTAELGEVSNNLERFPARTDSLAILQASVEYAQRHERKRITRERILRPQEPYASADILTAAASPPMRLPLLTLSTRSSSST